VTIKELVKVLVKSATITVEDSFPPSVDIPKPTFVKLQLKMKLLSRLDLSSNNHEATNNYGSDTPAETISPAYTGDTDYAFNLSTNLLPLHPFSGFSTQPFFKKFAWCYDAASMLRDSVNAAHDGAVDNLLKTEVKVALSVNQKYFVCNKVDHDALFVLALFN
jgi:hypothetical protein